MWPVTYTITSQCCRYPNQSGRVIHRSIAVASRLENLTHEPNCWRQEKQECPVTARDLKRVVIWISFRHSYTAHELIEFNSMLGLSVSHEYLSDVGCTKIRIGRTHVRENVRHIG